MVRVLTEEWNERLAGYGMTVQGLVIELWVGADSWSIVMSYPNGVSCLQAAGQGWTPHFGGCKARL